LSSRSITTVRARADRSMPPPRCPSRRRRSGHGPCGVIFHEALTHLPRPPGTDREKPEGNGSAATRPAGTVAERQHLEERRALLQPPLRTKATPGGHAAQKTLRSRGKPDTPG
jgi:hypothetical protein